LYSLDYGYSGYPYYGSSLDYYGSYPDFGRGDDYRDQASPIYNYYYYYGYPSTNLDLNTNAYPYYYNYPSYNIYGNPSNDKYSYPANSPYYQDTSLKDQTLLNQSNFQNKGRQSSQVEQSIRQ
jgi:hypothetical protein